MKALIKSSFLMVCVFGLCNSLYAYPAVGEAGDAQYYSEEIPPPPPPTTKQSVRLPVIIQSEGDALIVAFTTAVDEAAIIITDSATNVVYDEIVANPTVVSIDLDTLPSGTYLCEVWLPNGQVYHSNVMR